LTTTGVSGEHIADYICAQEFGWGRDWDGHDKGADGVWLEGKPSAQKMGKLSHGGNPKLPHVLYKLTDGANGTGIDSVWRADPKNNMGKNFAIVEAKASKDEDAPKFLRKLNNTKKPSIVSRLGVSSITDIAELLEPIEPVVAQVASNKKNYRSAPADNTTKSRNQIKLKSTIIQMSREWISTNIKKSFGVILSRKIELSYSRHLFYAPLYHPSGSPKTHAVSRLEGSGAEVHNAHSAFHYGESEVKAAVNRKKKRLAKKHGASSTLALES
jgi:hypothetical protein